MKSKFFSTLLMGDVWLRLLQLAVYIKKKSTFFPTISVDSMIINEWMIINKQQLEKETRANDT